MLKKFFMFATAAMLLIVVSSGFVFADDETEQVRVKVEATLDAVDCLAVPPTISVLGLTVDISTAKFDVDADTDSDDPEDVNELGDSSVTSCADLVVGQKIELKLASDISDPISGFFKATSVEAEDGESDDEGEEVEVVAPIQSIDLVGMRARVLGLDVDISQAEFEGADDEDVDENDLPVDPSQLMVGQFIELEMDSAQLPLLVAKELEVKNFSNQVEVVVVDQDGNEIEDEDDDIQIDVKLTTKTLVGGMLQANAISPKVKKKTLRFRTTSNGGANLSGLPTGKAKIVVTRIHDGRKSTKSATVNVLSNQTKRIVLRLKVAR